MAAKRFKSSEVLSSSHIWEQNFFYGHSQQKSESNTFNQFKREPESCPIKWEIFLDLSKTVVPMYRRQLPCNGTITLGIKRSDSVARDVKASFSYEIRNENFKKYDVKCHETTFTDECREYIFPTIPKPNNNPNDAFYFDGKGIWIDVTIEVKYCCLNVNIDEVLEDCKSQFQLDCKSLLSSELADLTLEVEGEKIPAHRCILSVRCPVFYEYCLDKLKNNGDKDVKITSMGKNTCKEFLSFIYTGSLENTTNASLRRLFSLANELQFETLRDSCKALLISDLKVDTFYATFKLAEEHRDNALKDTVTEWICNHFSEVKDTPYWKNFEVENTNLAKSISQRFPSSMK